MTLEQLRIFVAVAYIEHFTRAAERLGISQSAVSAAIAALESRYKILLFDRSHRHVELTPAGNSLLLEAEQILARVDLTTRRLDDLANLRIGRVAVAASQTVANYWLPPHLVTLQQRYPGVVIDVWCCNSSEVEKRVARGEADVGIIERQPSDDAFTVETLIADELVAVVGAKHAWFGRERVGWHELPQTPWIMRELGSGTRALFEAALVDHCVPPAALDIALVLRSGEAVRSAVVASTCAAVISSLLSNVSPAAGSLHQLEPITIFRNFNALLPRGRPTTRATAVLLDHLRSGGAVSSPNHDFNLPCAYVPETDACDSRSQ
jgi:DNA-binding transcriptional LysR family regulator